MKTSSTRSSAPKIENQSKRRGAPAVNGSRATVPFESLQIRSILAPVDFSEPSTKALKYAAAFAERFGAKLTLLHVVEPMGIPDFAATFPLVIESEKLVRRSEDKLRGWPNHCDIKTRFVEKTLVRTGKAFHEITEAARTLKVDLIIIATNGATGVKHLLLGSTTERVVRYAACPVFVVREQERDILRVE
jgi:nucleotide-binding universal stress UspA family protein